jgi:hypothetical protein
MKGSACQILLGIDVLSQLEADISYRSEVLILGENNQLIELQLYSKQMLEKGTIEDEYSSDEESSNAYRMLFTMYQADQSPSECFNVDNFECEFEIGKQLYKYQTKDLKSLLDHNSDLFVESNNKIPGIKEFRYSIPLRKYPTCIKQNSTIFPIKEGNYSKRS